MNTPTSALSLHIDRLVLDGVAFDARDRALLTSALQTELARLLAERGPGAALTAGPALARLSAGALTLPQGADAPQMGRAIAQALHQGLAS